MENNTSRIETLVDGVFAIAMTLLVLDLKIQSGLPHEQFLQAAQDLAPQFLAYLVSFMVLAVYWIGHHNQYFWIKRVDRIFIWINVFFLMAIAFVPFSTSILASYPHEIFAIFIYGANVTLAGLALYFHWKYAAGRGQLVEGYLDKQLSKSIEGRILLGMVFYIVAVMLGFVSTIISVVMFAALPFFYIPFSDVDKFFKGTPSTK